MSNEQKQKLTSLINTFIHLQTKEQLDEIKMIIYGFKTLPPSSLQPDIEEFILASNILF